MTEHLSPRANTSSIQRRRAMHSQLMLLLSGIHSP